MKKYILSLFCLCSPFGVYSQTVNTNDLVEEAVFARTSQSICDAYAAIIQGRSLKTGKNPNMISNLSKAINENEIVIEFFELPKSSGGSNYLAFVLKHGMDAPILYHICSSDGLLSLQDSECNFYNDTKMLTAITTPLAEELKGVTTIYFVPDGKLHEIALEYCKDTNGKMFCENYEVYRLTSAASIANKRQHKEYNNFSVWGGIDFQAFNLPYCDEDENLPRYKSPVEDLHDSYLAAVSIVKELEDKHKNVTFLHDGAATETNFKAMSGQQIDAFLIETHGIFTKECSITTKSGSYAPLDNHALALYGAAFTMDAGIVPQGQEDGLISEDEISKLDLSHIDLAVISACKSGLGSTKWDGVRGLMRGFKQAGVNSLVMTLDDVVDYVSGQLWIQFFRNLTNGQSKREALLNGIKYIRTMDNGAFSHPKYWTPFILIDGIE